MYWNNKDRTKGDGDLRGYYVRIYEREGKGGKELEKEIEIEREMEREGENERERVPESMRKRGLPNQGKRFLEGVEL